MTPDLFYLCPRRVPLVAAMMSRIIRFSSAPLAGPMPILFIPVGIPMLAPASGGVIVYGLGIDPVVAGGLTRVAFSGEFGNWLEDFRSGRAALPPSSPLRAFCRFRRQIPHARSPGTF